MKSNVITLKKNSKLELVLEETEKISKYNELGDKESLRLRLLTEELLTLIPHFLDYCEGKLWLENDGMEYSIHVSLTSTISTYEAKNKLLTISTTGKNAAYVGIMGKIRGAVEYMLGGYTDASLDGIEFYDGDNISDFYLAGTATNPLYSSMWSLDNYRQEIEEDKKSKENEWDELEKSIIANLADDVTIGIKGDIVDMIVTKKF